MESLNCVLETIKWHLIIVCVILSKLSNVLQHSLTGPKERLKTVAKKYYGAAEEKEKKKKIHFEAVIGAGWSWRCERQAEGRQAGDLKQEMWELQSKCNGHKNLVSYCYLKDSKAGRLKMRVDWRLEPGETCLQGKKKTPPTHSHKK